MGEGTRNCDGQPRTLFMASPDERPAESTLLARLRAGDRAAFEQIFREHFDGLAGFAYRLTRSRAIAEELVQDLFLEIWLRRDRLVITETLRTYLFRAARNRAFNHLRRNKLERLWRLRQPQLPEAEVVENEDSTDELAAAIRVAIASLPDRCREIFLLSREQNMTYAEIAKVLGLSIKTVETQMGRALKALRTRLDVDKR
jgi:RNA polymerase sigma-70 factor (ECF subfamily)